MDVAPIHQTLLDLIHLAVLPAWALLLFAPRWAWTDRIVHSGLYPVGLGLVYVGFVIASVLTGPPDTQIDFATVEGIAAIFTHPFGVLTGWVHFLVFDLFVGMWIGRDARRQRITHWLVAPCLVFAFVAGPLGLLLYFGIRRKWSIDPEVA
ncbi:MAG: ABA4-like family protein [Pseudomonadota bacterium]